MYSRVAGSSTVRRCDWHSVRARLIRILASAVRPAQQQSAVSRSAGNVATKNKHEVNWFLTGKGHDDVVVEKADLADRPVLLQLCDCLLLYAENDAVGATHPDGGRPLLDRLLCVLNLKNMPLRNNKLPPREKEAGKITNNT